MATLLQNGPLPISKNWPQNWKMPDISLVPLPVMINLRARVFFDPDRYGIITGGVILLNYLLPESYARYNYLLLLLGFMVGTGFIIDWQGDFPAENPGSGQYGGISFPCYH